jgi:hypothetical protein
LIRLYHNLGIGDSWHDCVTVKRFFPLLFHRMRQSCEISFQTYVSIGILIAISQQNPSFCANLEYQIDESYLKIG